MGQYFNQHHLITVIHLRYLCFKNIGEYLKNLDNNLLNYQIQHIHI